MLDTSDLPAGVVNIVTGEAKTLAKTLAEHDGVDALWYAGDEGGARRSRRPLPAISKATWTSAAAIDWREAAGARVPAPRDAGEEYLDAVRGVGSGALIAAAPSHHTRLTA